jgi:hypothetical protein
MELPAESRAPRPWVAAALLAVLGALLFFGVFFGGGSGDAFLAVGGTLAALAAAGAVAAAVLGWTPAPRLDRPGVVLVAAAVALVAWTGLSIVWSIAGDRSWVAFGKGLVYLSFLILGLVAVAASGPRPARAIAGLLSVVVGAALAWALLGRAVPAAFPDGGRIARLRNPIGYWNGLALLADAALPLGLWLAVELRSRLVRGAGALLVYGGVLVVLLTQSRAGVIAAAVVVLVWLASSHGERLGGGVCLVFAAVPAGAVAGWVFTRPALVDDGVLRADRAHDGAIFGVLALLGAVAAVVLWSRVPVERIVARRPLWVARALGVAAAATVLAGVVGVSAAVGNPVSWGRDQFSRGECVNTPGRLTELCANNRLAWWREAWDVFSANKTAGTGAQTFQIARKRVRDESTEVSEPHSVPLQLLSDLGPLGFLLGGTAAAAAVLGLLASLRRLGGAERAAAVALVGFPAVYGVHALVDYDLDFVALTVPTLVAVAALLVAGRPVALRRRSLPAAIGAGVVAVAVAAVLVAPALAEREVDRATLLLERGRVAAADRAVDRARAFDPLSLDPVYTAADVADERGDTAAAAAFYRRATELQPENPEPWVVLGLYEYIARRDMCAAYQALNAAYTLDPKGRRWVPGGPLDVSKDAVNHGACEPPA